MVAFVNKMNEPSEREKRHLAVLLGSSKLSNVYQESSVCTERRKTFCGWKAIRPSAVYTVPPTPFATKKKKNVPEIELSRHVTFDSTTTVANKDFPYMNGHLDDEYSYVYGGGLRPEETASRYPSTYKYFPTQTRSTIELEPAVQYRCPDPSTQIDISRIVSMQLKPEVLVEQLLIENRLRTMSLAAIPTLNLEGVGVRSDKSTQKSDSAPLLRKSTHQSVKKRRTKLQTPLEWCHLNTMGGGVDTSSPPQLELRQEEQLQAQPAVNFAFDNFSYSRQGRQNGLNFRHRLNPDLNTKPNHYPTANKQLPERRPHPQQQSVHVVEPMLDRTIPLNGQHRGSLEPNAPNTLTSLLKLWKNTPVRF